MNTLQGYVSLDNGSGKGCFIEYFTKEQPVVTVDLGELSFFVIKEVQYMLDSYESIHVCYSNNGNACLHIPLVRASMYIIVTVVYYMYCTWFLSTEDRRPEIDNGMGV